MTDTQKRDVIALYNAATAALADALDLMDRYTDGSKAYHAADSDATKALATQQAIDAVLSALDYDIIVNDADGIALDIISK